MSDSSTEKWVSIEGSNEYEVSSWGRIRRITPGGRWNRIPSGTFVNPWSEKNGYQRVELTIHNRKKKFLVHVLVCKSFYGLKPTPKHEVAHNDGNPLNNNKENVRWATKKENSQDAIKHRTQPRGEKSGASKITESMVKEIRSMYKNGIKICVIARIFSITPSHTGRVARGRYWSHLN